MSVASCSYATKALVLGVQMRALGHEYARDLWRNNITSTWTHPNHFSSWCLFHRKTLNAASNAVNVVERFGQLDYFFRLSCARDEYMNGLAFSSVVSKKHQISKKVNSMDASDVSIIIAANNQSLERFFAPLRHFVSTNVAFIPLDDVEKPFSILTYQRSKLTTESLRHCSSKQSEDIHSLIMIPLRPYRRGVTLTVEIEESFDFTEK